MSSLFLVIMYGLAKLTGARYTQGKEVGVETSADEDCRIDGEKAGGNAQDH